MLPEPSPPESNGTPATNPNTIPPHVGDQPAPPRTMGQFASFALAMSTICILAGGVTSFHVGFCSVGGASIGIGWPLCLLFSLAVALTMGQVASAFPRAGGPSEWAAELGGNGWGWVAGCFNLLGLLTATAAVNFGFCKFVVDSFARVFDYDPEAYPVALKLFVIAATMLQAFVNHRGIRLTILLTNFSGYLIIAVALIFTLLLLICIPIYGRDFEFSRLITPVNFSGLASGDKVWPATGNMIWLFALGLLLPAYTFTAFDASAQTAEETRDPEINVPKAIWQAVLMSGIAGWVVLSAVVLAAPDMAEAAQKGDGSFLHIIRAATPRWTHAALYIGIGAAMFFCGLACVTASSRLAWALGRDNGLPFSRQLSRIGTHKTPSIAIWAVSIAAALMPVAVGYEIIAAVCAIFFYIAYVVPTACGLVTYGRWPRTGPWHLGRWYPPLAVICVLGCVGLVILGVQPTTDSAVNPALWMIPLIFAALLALWFGYFRFRFRLRDEVANQRVPVAAPAVKDL